MPSAGLNSGDLEPRNGLLDYRLARRIVEPLAGRCGEDEVDTPPCSEVNSDSIRSVRLLRVRPGNLELVP